MLFRPSDVERFRAKRERAAAPTGLCPKGLHEMEDAYVLADGNLRCRVCHREWSRLSQARVRARRKAEAIAELAARLTATE